MTWIVRTALGYSVVVALSAGMMAFLAADGQTATDKSKDHKARSRHAGKTEARVRYTVAPGTRSTITMKTLPGATTATLHQEGKSGSGRGVKLHAQQDGTLRFSVRPAAKSKGIEKFFVESKVGDKIHRYPLELRFSSKPTAEMPAPHHRHAKSTAKGNSVRKALSRDEIRNLSNAALLKKGYPMRPDRKHSPKAFDAWRKAVSSPFTVVKHHTVHADRRSALARIPHSRKLTAKLNAGSVTEVTANNWSGFELRGAANGTYDRVEGTWKVPFVTGPPLPIPSSTPQLVAYSSFWVGLDGDPNGLPANTLGGLWQAGTEQKATTLNLGTTTLEVEEYYAWYELFPDPENKIVNFTVEPGDEIQTQVWIGNNLGQPTPSPTHYGFTMQNLTKKEATGFTAVIGNTKIVGREAVWIMESPSFNDKFGLSEYFTATMTNAFARLASSPAGQGFVAYKKDPKAQLIQFKMTSDGSANSTTLSSVASIDDSSMRFTWGAFR
jgi:hypothetical protein